MTFDELFDDLYPRLHRYCTRLSADSDMGEDVAQEAFVRLLDRKVEGDPPRLRAWLFKVATHLIRDQARIRENRSRLLEENPVTLEAGPSLDEVVERREMEGRARRALDSLDERERRLLLMREEGFSYREMAEAIGAQSSSVGTLLARARRRFAQVPSQEEGALVNRRIHEGAS